MSEEELITRKTSQIATLRMKYADNEALYGLLGDEDETMMIKKSCQREMVPLLTLRQIYPRIRWVSLLNPRQVISTVNKITIFRQYGEYMQ